MVLTVLGEVGVDITLSLTSADRFTEDLIGFGSRLSTFVGFDTTQTSHKEKKKKKS